MYFFARFNDNLLNKIKTRYKYFVHSSDISPIEGIVVTEDDLDILNQEFDLSGNTKCILYMIPQNYQEDIKAFETDYWDGNFTFDGAHLKFRED